MRPMLLPRKTPDISKLPYPLLMSPKLDGFRCIITEDGPRTRSPKTIANPCIREYIQRLPVGFDGELMAGHNPADKDVFNKTTSLVRNGKKHADWRDFSFWIFDDATMDGVFDLRHKTIAKRIKQIHLPFLFAVPQYVVTDVHDVNILERKFLEEGYEGGILRTPEGEYLHKAGENRASHSDMIGWKLKQFEDFEAEVIGMEPLMHNHNEAFLSEKGLQKRSKVASGLVASDCLMGKLKIKDLKTKVVSHVGSGFTEEQRRWWFKHWKGGHIITCKKFKHGEKDKPRHAIFKGIRDESDIL